MPVSGLIQLILDGASGMLYEDMYAYIGAHKFSTLLVMQKAGVWSAVVQGRL